MNNASDKRASDTRASDTQASSDAGGRMPSPLEVLLIVGIVLLVAAHVTMPTDPQERNFVYAPNMADSPAYRAQDANPNFSDDKTLQRPVVGTIARGALPLHVGDVVLDTTTLRKDLSPAQKAAWDALSPAFDWSKMEGKAKAPVLARGAFIFSTFCATCHGASGGGDGVMTKRGVPPPKSFQDADMRELSDGQMFRSISYGQANMPSYASQVRREDRWAVIRYIRSLQQAP